MAQTRSFSPTTAGLAVKVPAATALFWVIKTLTTGMGETTSDYLVTTLKPQIAVIMGAIALAVALAVQILAPRFRPWLYWTAVLMVGIFGTMAADVVHTVIGIPYEVSSVGFALALAGVFWFWRRSEGTLSIHSITNPRREVLYWLVVLCTFALGTALGDLTAHPLGLGYFKSAVMYAVLIAVPAIAYWKFGLNDVVAFWAAYVVTRPLGASFADWFGAPVKRGGLGYGWGPVSLVLFVIFLALVAYAARTRDGEGRAEA
jgi:uncharacterized membrane-anchored protein